MLEDTLVFDSGADNGELAPTGASGGAVSDKDLTIALISSDKYDTETLIEKLKKDKRVEKVEPNWYIYPTSPPIRRATMLSL